MDTARGYLSTTELETLTGLGLGNDAAAKQAIAKAEAMIDSYVGFWQKAIVDGIEGLARAGSATTLRLSAEDTSGHAYKNIFVGCTVEALGGTGAGQTAIITSNEADGTLTFDTVSTPFDATTFYRVYQVGKFPRRGTRDLFNSDDSGQTVYYRVIPRPIKEAVAAQVEYMQKMGASFFEGGDSNVQSESMDGYSYTKGEGGSNGKGLLAPRVRSILSGTGLINRTGQITTPNTI